MKNITIRNSPKPPAFMQYLLCLVMVWVTFIHCAGQKQIYPGPERPKEEVCTIYGNWMLQLDDVTLKYKEVQNLSILPGQHHLIIKPKGSLIAEYPQELDFISEPGGLYYVEVKAYKPDKYHTYLKNQLSMEYFWQPTVVKVQFDSGLYINVTLFQGINNDSCQFIENFDKNFGMICVYNPEYNLNPLNLPQSTSGYKPKTIFINNKGVLTLNLSDYAKAFNYYVEPGLCVLKETHKIFKEITKVIKIDVKPGFIYFIRCYHNNSVNIDPVDYDISLMELKGCKVSEPVYMEK